MYYFGQLQIFTSSAVGLEHFNIEESGKVVLPPSVLANMSDFSSETPMLFHISHPVTEALTHCGVIEFSAEEGSVVAPSWVLDQIGVVPGETVYVETMYLPVGTYARFKPQSVTFLEITNQKAVLENRLRNFSCLTCGDLIPIHYNDKTFYLKVVNTQPGDAICIVNCDLEVEFEEPVGYTPSKPQKTEEQKEMPNGIPSTVEPLPFTGTGYRLDGKIINNQPTQPNQSTSRQRGIPDFDWSIGTLNFYRGSSSSNLSPGEEDLPCQNSGRSLK